MIDRAVDELRRQRGPWQRDNQPRALAWESTTRSGGELPPSPPPDLVLPAGHADRPGSTNKEHSCHILSPPWSWQARWAR